MHKFVVWETDQYGEHLFFVIHSGSQVVVFAGRRKEESERMARLFNESPRYTKKWAVR